MSKIVFFSSYPYSEERDVARSYLRARCPAWCDRIFLSHSFNNFIRTEVKQKQMFNSFFLFIYPFDRSINQDII